MTRHRQRFSHTQIVGCQSCLWLLLFRAVYYRVRVFFQLSSCVRLLKDLNQVDILVKMEHVCGCGLCRSTDHSALRRTETLGFV